MLESRGDARQTQDLDLEDPVTAQLLREQQLRHETFSELQNVKECLAPFTAPPQCVELRAPLVAAGDAAPSPPYPSIVSPDVQLAASPFPRRRPTIWLEPYDRPWDGDPYFGCPCAYVRPTPLSVGQSHASGGATACTKTEAPLLRRVPRSDTGPYAKLTYILDKNAVPFTSLLATLERAGFRQLTPREALLDRSWSLKWAKHALLSDFKGLCVASFQKLNHFPGSWRLGKKDTLHQCLSEAEERWGAFGVPSATVPAAFGDGLYPMTWLIPNDHVACQMYLRDPRHAGDLFIVKPATGAGGRGVYLLHGGPHAEITPNASDTSRRAVRSIVQRYVSDPYLVQSYKADLRLYVVATCYEPVRLYVYEEGLVRFATTPYHELAPAGGAPVVASVDRLTAHLTNFTINKKSEDFVVPCRDGGTQISKWPLSALLEYMARDGVDVLGTMRRVDDLLAKVFLSIVLHVRSEMRKLDADAAVEPKAHSLSPPPPAPPFTASGISPFFEIYGVDVLLRRGAAAGGRALHPVIMEVNIMPSLSTHYSPLDQCIKGNFVADTLNLVGLVPAALAKRVAPCEAAVVADHFFLAHPRRAPPPFLAEACVAAEEERRRGANFRRLLPTATSFARYQPLLEAHGSPPPPLQAATSAAEALPPPWRSLDEALSVWEAWREEGGLAHALTDTRTEAQR